MTFRAAVASLFLSAWVAGGPAFAADELPWSSPPPAAKSEAEAALARGEASYRAGRYADAEAAWEQALGLGAARGPALLAIGLARLKLGQYAKAADAFSQAEATGTAGAEAPYHLGLALALAGRAPEAVVAYRRAVALAPKDARIRNNLGQALLQTGDPAAARAAFDVAIALAPTQREPWYNLGLACEAAGDHAAALVAWRRALALSPGWALPLARLPGAAPTRLPAPPANADLDATSAATARRLGREGNWREATKAWRQAATGAPGAPEPYWRVALLLAAHGAPRSSLPLARKAVATAPRDARAWCALGGALVANEQLAEADHAYRQALALDASSRDARLGLAVLADGRGDAAGVRTMLGGVPVADPRLAALQALWKWRARPTAAARRQLDDLARRAAPGPTADALKLAGGGSPREAAARASRLILLDLP